METHNFQRSKERSETLDVKTGIEKALRAQLPGLLAIHQAAKANDMAGIDYWIEFAGGIMRSVDVKMRSRDYEAEGKPGAGAGNMVKRGCREMAGHAIQSCVITSCSTGTAPGAAILWTSVSFNRCSPKNGATGAASMVG
ncbi:MAG: hypothetical protein IPP36_07605 [Nitrosomonadales bacterium]|nr:hypothetical protein [Nitrosomonadales bacterium]